MISRGQKLYEMWTAAMLCRHGTSCDEWHELPPSELDAWEAVGEQIEFR